MPAAETAKMGRKERERLPHERNGPAMVVYVWQYGLRLAHWGLFVSMIVLGYTGYYIHNPFIPGRTDIPFLMGWFRLVHEYAAVVFTALCLLRFWLFFRGNYWAGWRQIVPLKPSQFREMTEIMMFYAFLRPRSIPRVGHNAAAAASYIAVYGMAFLEIVTGLVLYNWQFHSAVLNPLVGWIPLVVNIQYIRLIHFLMTFAFIAYGIVHVHLCLINAKLEKCGLMDSIFTGYKVIPVEEINKEDREAIERLQEGRTP